MRMFGQVVAVVGVQHRAVGDGQREVLAPAAAEEVGELQPEDAPLIVHPGPVVDAQVVPLAGDHHVIVAVIAHAGGPPQAVCRDGAGDGQRVALDSLPPKPPPMRRTSTRTALIGRWRAWATLCCTSVGCWVEEWTIMSPPFLRDRGGDLAFEVEMLLPANLERAFDQLRGLGDCAGGIALLPDDRPLLEPAACGKGIIDGQKGGKFIVGHLAQPRRLARGEVGFGHDKEDGLADVVDGAHGQQGLVMRRGAAIGHLGQVFGREDRDHAGGGANGGKVEAGDLAMRNGRQPEGQMQRVRRQGQVVDVTRLAGHMQRGRVVWQGFAHAHGETSSTETGVP
jgi:hypothetical protein